jgi:hypothetical protein
MAQLTLGRIGRINSTVSRWLSVAIAVGLLGLGVKAIWFDSQGYLVPARSIPVGANLANEKFRLIHANLGQIGGAYLSNAKKPKGFAQSTLPADHFVSLDSVSRWAPATVERIVVTNKTQLGSGVHAGAKVSIWSAKRLENNQFDVLKRLAASATVARVIKGSAVFGSQNQQVEVLVNPTQTPALLEAMSSDSPIFLVAEQ